MAEKIVAVTDGTDDGLRSKKDNFFPRIFASKSVFKSFIQALLACSVFISFVGAMICMVKCKCNRCKKVSAMICMLKRKCNRCSKVGKLCSFFTVLRPLLLTPTQTIFLAAPSSPFLNSTLTPIPSATLFSLHSLADPFLAANSNPPPLQCTSK